MSRDIKIDNFSVTFHGTELLQDTKLELSCGQRYGLIGDNGSGKYQSDRPILSFFVAAALCDTSSPSDMFQFLMLARSNLHWPLFTRAHPLIEPRAYTGFKHKSNYSVISMLEYSLNDSMSSILKFFQSLYWF